MSPCEKIAARKGGHRFRRLKKKEGVPLGSASKIPQQALNILRVQVAYQNIYTWYMLPQKNNCKVVFTRFMFLAWRGALSTHQVHKQTEC